MPYTKILSRSFETVRREPALWVLGIILAFFGGGQGGSGGSGNWSQPSGGTDGQDFPTELPSWFTPEVLIPLAVVVVLVLVALSILFFVMRCVALAGLVHGAQRAATGEDVHWNDLFRFGWSQVGRRIMGLQLLLWSPWLVLLLLMAGIGLAFLVPLASAAMSGVDPTVDPSFFGGLFAFLGLAICLAILLSAASWIVGLVQNYAVRAIVVEGQAVSASLRTGWELFKRNVADTLVFSIMLGVIGLVVGGLTGVLLVVVILMAGIPLALFLASQSFPLTLTLAVAIPAILLIGIVSAFLQGPLLAFFETAWTLAWQHLTNPESEVVVPERPVPPAVSPA